MHPYLAREVEKDHSPYPFDKYTAFRNQKLSFWEEYNMREIAGHYAFYYMQRISVAPPL